MVAMGAGSNAARSARRCRAPCAEPSQRSRRRGLTYRLAARRRPCRGYARSVRILCLILACSALAASARAQAPAPSADPAAAGEITTADSRLSDLGLGSMSGHSPTTNLGAGRGNPADPGRLAGTVTAFGEAADVDARLAASPLRASQPPEFEETAGGAHLVETRQAARTVKQGRLLHGRRRPDRYGDQRDQLRANFKTRLGGRAAGRSWTTWRIGGQRHSYRNRGSARDSVGGEGCATAAAARLARRPGDCPGVRFLAVPPGSLLEPTWPSIVAAEDPTRLRRAALAPGWRSWRG